MSTFTLAISCLTTSNFPWFMDLTFQVPMQYCSIADLASIISHIHNWVLFLLWLHSFILSGVISPVISSSILGTYQPRSSLSVSYHFAFSYCSWGSQGKNKEVVCHSLLQWTTFCQTSPLIPVHLGWPHRARLSFIELDKAVVRVIRLTCFLWLWFQCVCPLMPSRNTYHLTWVSLTWMWGISSRLIQQSSATAPYPGQGHLSWLWTWSSSSEPSCTWTATTPWMRGCSSRPPALCLRRPYK